MPAPIIVWFRQDLRLSDNPALHAAAATGAPLMPDPPMSMPKSSLHKACSRLTSLIGRNPVVACCQKVAE